MIYRLDDICESHDFEHDQKFVKVEHWKEACEEANEANKSARFLQSENQMLREALQHVRNLAMFGRHPEVIEDYVLDVLDKLKE